MLIKVELQTIEISMVFNNYLDGFSMKSYPIMSSMPRVFSCSTTFARLHLFISGMVESLCMQNSDSGYNLAFSRPLTSSTTSTLKGIYHLLHQMQ